MDASGNEAASSDFTFSTQPMIWTDGRIGIILDEVERLDTMPPEFEERRPPRKGYEYVGLYLTIAHIEVEHMGYSKLSTLIDLEGNEYQEKAFTSRGVRFGNLEHLTASYEFIEGTTMVLIFELPKQAKPTTLEFVYPFCESELWKGWEDKSIIEWGQIEIIL